MQLSYLNTSAAVNFFPSLQVRKNLQVQSFIKAVSFFIPYSILAGLGGLTGTTVRGRGREERGRKRGVEGEERKRGRGRERERRRGREGGGGREKVRGSTPVT